MLLKNVNLKYPATISLNSEMDSNPNEPDIVMQKAFDAKNQAVDKPIGEAEKKTTTNIQMIENMINWIGSNQTICSAKFELSTVVKELLKKYIEFKKFDLLRDLLKKLSDDNKKKKNLTVYMLTLKVYTQEVYMKQKTPK